MRVFKYWAEYGRILNVDGFQQYSKARGGSNVSVEDAEQRAIEKLDKAQQIINGLARKDKDYEADIVEEIIERLDDKNVVTRNRYGALVLNSTNHVFIDIDDYVPGILDWLLKPRIPKKQLLLQKIEQTMNKPKYAHHGFRLYETAKGYRLMVSNMGYEARSSESKALMKNFGADYIYEWLCISQNCYRARLTPKPFRIKQKALRVIFPNRTEQQQKEHEAWFAEYENLSRGYSTCRLVKQMGPLTTNRVIEYHDRMTGIRNNYRLA